MATRHQQQLALHLAGGASQRWLNRRVRYRPPGEVFDPRFAEVVPIDEGSARALVEQHHYSGTFPAARYRTGIVVKRPFQREWLGGTAVFSVPMSDAVITKWLDVDSPRQGIELGRLVLIDHPDLAANAESWMAARSFRLLRQALPDIRGVVAFCDPVARVDVYGQLTKPGHTGVIYRALSAAYKGTTSPRTHLLTPDGWIVSPRALSKIRNDERGAAYALRQLEAHGRALRRRFEQGSDYIERLKREGVLRPLRHGGNLSFTWQWDRHGRLERQLA